MPASQQSSTDGVLTQSTSMSSEDQALVTRKVDEATNLILCAVKGRQTDMATNSRLIEWIKSMRDELRSAVKEDRQQHKEHKRMLRQMNKHRSTRAQATREKLESKKLMSEMYENRKKARAERKMERAFASLWRLSPSENNSPLSLGAGLDSVMRLSESLDEAVTSRDSSELEVDDCYAVEQLGQLLSSASIYEGLDGNLLVDEVPGVMTRYHLFQGKSVTVRLHLFHSLAETYVHNHKNNFSSMCLYGSYVHSNWITDPDHTSGHHYQFIRGGDGTLSKPEQLPGKLLVSNKFTHEMNKVYFLSKEAFHTVLEQSSEAHLKGTLTLYVKGKGGLPHTKVLSDTPEFEDGDPQLDVVLEGEKKEHALQQMAAMLRLAAADQLRSTF
eukprot:TRINITY_DN2000_c1_g1_i1.p1 TRINITY_DN2000_c1_g1~~TRINITY_DN2000_c1_g1_i1.p1  ORF type:complete len:386 (+),score=74.17 TRINITY_DN2000_c1_g1_i1:52-1209(+)